MVLMVVDLITIEFVQVFFSTEKRDYTSIFPHKDTVFHEL